MEKNQSIENYEFAVEFSKDAIIKSLKKGKKTVSLSYRCGTMMRVSMKILS